MKKLIVANWKMNKTISETEEFFLDLNQRLDSKNLHNLIFCVPYLSLPKAVEVTSGTGVKIFAQNCHFEKSGAYTGEVSPDMLYDCGVNGVLIGHSERRRYFFEKNEFIRKKIKAALDCGLDVILCVGESLEERQNDTSHESVSIQIKSALTGLSCEFSDKISVAYEPLWAIGTGITAELPRISDMCGFLKNTVNAIFGSKSVKILYGGSVNVGNASEILEIPEVDGVLVGGASLDVENIVAICGI